MDATVHKVPAQDGDKRLLWYLKKVPLLGDIGTEPLTRLADKIEIREVRRRQVIYLPGDPGAAVYFVNGGRVKVSKVTRDGKELTLAYRGPGELFGETCIIDGGPREEMAEAMDNSLVTEVERADFERLLYQSASFAARIVKMLAERRRNIENKIENLIFKDVNAKLAELLLSLG